MSDKPLNWLPEEALTSPALLSALDEVCAAWSQRWFGARGLIRQQAARSGEKRLVPGKHWQAFSRGLWLESSEATRCALARHALDAKTKPGSDSDADLALLDLLAGRMIEDLAQALAALLRLPRQTVSDGAEPRAAHGLTLRLTGPGTAPLTLDIYLAHSALVALRKAQCPPWSAPAARHSSLGAVVGSEKARVEAVLGKARMSALDLADIAPGDVVVIDRPTDEKIELRRAETGTLLAAARLVQGEQGLVLQAD